MELIPDGFSVFLDGFKPSRICFFFFVVCAFIDPLQPSMHHHQQASVSSALNQDNGAEDFSIYNIGDQSDYHIADLSLLSYGC
jgi:hypothetical protein